jgi:hypothetical protein
MIYTGVGSRSCPLDIKDQIILIASSLAKRGYTLRSGGADGSDNFFEIGCDFATGKKEIYLPWKGFNKNKSELYGVSDEALKLASTIHPAWDYCSIGAKKLHGRNIFQILGKELNQPSNLLICWTQDGKAIGGTRTAIILAQKYNIPIYNLGNQTDLIKAQKDLL